MADSKLNSYTLFRAVRSKGLRVVPPPAAAAFYAPVPLFWNTNEVLASRYQHQENLFDSMKGPFQTTSHADRSDRTDWSFW